MEPPTGFVRLCEAVYKVGSKEFGPDWRPVGDLAVRRLFDPEPERVIVKIAEWCEAGEITAVYRSITGVDELDPSVWRRPHWRHYFADGTIDLELPLLDINLRANPDGHTARCTREIFLRRDDLDGLISPASETSLAQPTPAIMLEKPSRKRHPRAKFVQNQAEQRLLFLFPESRGVPPANLRPKDILDRVNQDLSPKGQFLRDTVSRAVENLKGKAKQNQ